MQCSQYVWVCVCVAVYVHVSMHMGMHTNYNTCMCALDGEGARCFLVLRAVALKMCIDLTSYSDCRTSFCEPLLPPYRSVTLVWKMSGVTLTLCEKERMGLAGTWWEWALGDGCTKGHFYEGIFMILSSLCSFIGRKWSPQYRLHVLCPCAVRIQIIPSQSLFQTSIKM